MSSECYLSDLNNLGPIYLCILAVPRIRLITDINTVFGSLVQSNNMQQDRCSLIYEETIDET